MSVFKNTSGSDLNISQLAKYIDCQYSETIRPSQTKTQGCCSEDINCSTSLFNEQNDKQHGSFSKNEPALRKFINLSDVDLELDLELRQHLILPQTTRKLGFIIKQCKQKYFTMKRSQISSAKVPT